MIVARDIPAARDAVAAARRAGRTIGFVPTMGALHAGHESLIEASRRRASFVVVSVFVNPTQFAPGEDFAAYPRDEPRDLECCRRCGVDLVFAPAVEELYPPDSVTRVHVERLTEHLCGARRPGHFDGVALIVAKLLNIIQPDFACFGEKDAQQLAVVRRLVRDLNIPVEIVGCPTVREPDGLAMSSRNAYLDPTERVQARCLYAALCDARDRVAAGERDAAALIEAMRRIVTAAGPCSIDYISIVDPDSMQPLDRVRGPALAALAVRIGKARLIDNLRIEPSGTATGADRGRP